MSDTSQNTVFGRGLNPEKLDLLQVVNEGESVAWRLSQNGSQLYYGTSDPTSTAGFVQFEFFLNTTTGELFQNVSNAWVSVTMFGPQGPQGIPGPSGTVTSNSGATIGGSLSVKGPIPWVDVTTYGAKARTTFLTTTASTSGTAVTLGAAEDFVNGDGIVIWQAGAATSQSTPSAPTVVCGAVTGSQTFNYKCVGYDRFGGLTAASSAGQCTNAPAIFGNVPCVISSISLTSNVVTVNTSIPINAVPGQQVTIVHVTGAGATWIGTYVVASAPTTSSFTYAFTGADGTGTVSSVSTARLCNTYNITAITRSGTTISVTTNANHNFGVQSGGFGNYSRTIVCIQGIEQGFNATGTADFNGQYVLLSAPTSNTMTLDSAISATETGNLTAPGETYSPRATVYEYITVTCPAISGTTVGYYVYGDRGTGTYKLLGKTLPGCKTFTDYGDWQAPDYTAPAYVPTGTPNAGAQNQLYAGQIVSGGGTTSLIVTPTVPTAVSGQTAMHDETIAVANAISAARAATSTGIIYFPPQPGWFVFNSPLNVSPTYFYVNVIVAAGLKINETISDSGGEIKWSSVLGTAYTSKGSFSQTYLTDVTGYASPMILSTGGFNPVIMDGLAFTGNSGSGQTYIYSNAPDLKIDNCAFYVGGSTNSGTSVPIVLEGGEGYQSAPHISNSTFVGYSNGIGNGGAGASSGGDILLGPNIPLIWLRASESGSIAPSNFLMDGNNTFAGRGIMLDGTFGQFTEQADVSIYENEAPCTPTVMVYGTNTGFSSLNLKHFINDSQPGAILANWTPGNLLTDIVIDDCHTSGHSSILTGGHCPGIVFKNIAETLGQNFNYIANQIKNTTLGAETGVLNQGEPVIMTGPINIPLACQIPKITGVTASTSGSGNTPAGTVPVQVTAVGWNDNENIPSKAVLVTVNGSQGIAIGWTAVANIKGYNVYVSGVRQNAALIITNSYTVSTAGSSGLLPALDSTGLPLIDNTQVATPMLRLTTDTNHSVLRQAVQLNASTANLLALPTVLPILSAPGINKLIVIESWTAQYRFATTGYTLGNSDNAFKLVYHGQTTGLTTNIAAAGLVDQTANHVSWVSGGSIAGPAQTAAVNLGVDLTLVGTAPALTLGDGSLEIVLTYSVVDLS